MPGVVDDRMVNFIAFDRLANVLGVLLGFELGRMDADHHDFVGIGLLQLFELRQNVHAIDAAISPEVEQYKLAPQVAECQRLFRVEPLTLSLELWSGLAAGKRMLWLSGKAEGAGACKQGNDDDPA